VSKNQLELCAEVLRRLKREGLLDHLILVGSWCLIAYKEYFRKVRYRPGIRTRDIDLLIPIPPQFDHHVDLEALLKDLDFVISYKGRKGYIQLVHEQLMIEFLVPERGRGNAHPYPVPALGVNAQPLRFLDLLMQKTTRADFEGIELTVPHPANFALQKLIVASRRAEPVKQENDLRQAVDVLRAMVEAGEQNAILEVYRSIPLKWQRLIRKSLTDRPLAEAIVSLLS